MAVYVDKLFSWPVENTAPAARALARRTGGRWCHMWADSTRELITAAVSIGLKPEWIQKWHGSSIHHFDLTPNKRYAAIRKGALERSTLDIPKQYKEKE